MTRLGLIGLIAAAPLAAQQARPAVGAESGMYAEAYHIDGRPARRPAQSLRAFASPSFSWMGLEIGTTLLWSTESEFTAQSANRYYLNPRWSWGQVHAGDYTPVLSRLTASAVRIRGGGVELTPGKVRFSASGGRAQDATDLSAFDAAPRRSLYAGLLGFGDPNGTFIELSALRAIDDSAGTDTLSVAPQENAVGAVSAGLAVGRVRVRAELGASLFSRDVRASELDSLATPGVADGIFTPRLSSRVDHAWSAEARVALRAGSIGVQVDEIGPGFTTLGNPYLANDKREARVVAAYRVRGGRLAANGSIGWRRDNLAGDKRGTTGRRTGSLAVTLLSGRWLVSSVSVLANGLTRDPTPLPPGAPDPGIVDSFQLRNVSRSLVVMEQARFSAAGAPHTVTVSLSAQRVDDESPRFGAVLDASATTLAVDWSVTLAEQITLSVRPGHEWFRGTGRDESFGSLGLAAARRAPRSPWSANLAATYTSVGAGGQWRVDAGAGVRISARDQLTLQARYTRLRGVADPFSEKQAGLRLTHRW
jgi:hypothetical protein